MNTFDSVRALDWQGDALLLLDQRLLPHRQQWLRFEQASAVADAIRDMVVRGAPAIGIAAAYGAVLAARQAVDAPDPAARIQVAFGELGAARPTAVNLRWALARMEAVIAALPVSEWITALTTEAHAIRDEDYAANQTMAQLGADMLQQDGYVITHCNTGSLATSGLGTALGVIRYAYARGRIERVFADETRPWLQGSRLTAWELQQDNIPVTLMADGAAAALMAQGRVQWVIVGADRITADGSVANKIGTYSLAVNARYHGVKFMVVAPSSTVDMSLRSGLEIPIEERDPAELLSVGGQRVAADDVDAWNPSFDVTPGSLVDALVTERGVVIEPTEARMRSLFG
jgi:methylthioribose-1-phosphate isomerase